MSDVKAHLRFIYRYWLTLREQRGTRYATLYVLKNLP
jgi:hypothetical protein